MRKKILFFGVLSMFFAVSLTSCKKDKKQGCTDPNATNYDSTAEEDDGSCKAAVAAQPGGYTPKLQGEVGVLVGINTITNVSPGYGLPSMEVPVGTAAAFFTKDGGKTMLDIGSVSIDGNNLTKQTNNSYMYVPVAANPYGLTLGSAISWGGTGNSNWPSFSILNSKGFATISEITSGDITASSSYKLATTSLAGADSVYFAIYGPKGTAMTVQAASSTKEHTFTASQVSALGVGTGYVQIIGLTYDKEVADSKNYWLINETVRTKMVQIK